MPIIEGIGWIATAMMGFHSLPVAAALNHYNDQFAIAVDSGDSCWDRVSGTEGVYGGPHEFTLDAVCNYRIQHYTEEGTVSRWRLIRSD